MHLEQKEIEQFYKIWYGLMTYVNDKHDIVQRFDKPVYGQRFETKVIHAIREEMWANPQWLDEFLSDAAMDALNADEREIVKLWREHFVTGEFILMKHLSKYSVLMKSAGENTRLYGVWGISDSFSDMFEGYAPIMMKAVLLPFNGKIIYDSVLNPFNVSFGGGIRSGFNDEYKAAKAKFGIIERLDAPIVELPKKETPAAPKKSKPTETAWKFADADLEAEFKKNKIPPNVQGRYVEIKEILKRFSDEKLDAEYFELCLLALTKLCRKRPSPIEGGKVMTWACGIVYAVGQNNFIFDKSQPINMTATDISSWFGLANSTAGQKAKEITKTLKMSFYSPEFQLKSHVSDNPAIWTLSVNGYLVDVRHAPRDLQEEAFRKGLIPYIPDDMED